MARVGQVDDQSHYRAGGNGQWLAVVLVGQVAVPVQSQGRIGGVFLQAHDAFALTAEREGGGLVALCHVDIDHHELCAIGRDVCRAHQSIQVVGSSNLHTLVTRADKAAIVAQHPQVAAVDDGAAAREVAIALGAGVACGVDAQQIEAVLLSPLFLGKCSPVAP